MLDLLVILLIQRQLKMLEELPVETNGYTRYVKIEVSGVLKIPA